MSCGKEQAEIARDVPKVLSNRLCRRLSTEPRSFLDPP